MANLGRDGADIPLPISIETPIGSPRSHNLLQLETRTNASQDGASTVMRVKDAAREGMPSPVAINVLNQANLYQQIQRNEFAYNPTLQTLHVTTHDPGKKVAGSACASGTGRDCENKNGSRT